MRTPISRVFGQLGFLQFGRPAMPRTSPDEERVMNLFRSRAELKKSYNQLQGELLLLRDRLKQQEGVTARAQELLLALEVRLSQPESAYPAMVYYQLRDLWGVAHGLLEQQIRELRQQRESVERGTFERECQRQREVRVAGLQRSCDELAAIAHAATGPVHSLTLQLARQQGWWRYLQRRRLRRQLQAALQSQIEAADALQVARNEYELTVAEPEPRFPGLSLAMRRAINVTAIAYSQVLHQRLENSGLLEPMRSAIAAEEVPADEYGDRAACELLVGQIQRTRWSLQQRIMLKDELQQVTLGLRPLLRYSSDLSSVPEAATLAGDGVGTRVLLENAWEISRLLL